jgi:uncharacterized membrane protein
MFFARVKIARMSRWGLIAIVLLGTILRGMNLGTKPLWLDEVITGLFTFGQGYSVIPRETLFPVSTSPSFFSYQGQSCSGISDFLAEQSTHPPLFFCLTHHWLGLTQGLSFLDLSLAVQLRSLPAILGVIAVPLLYHLNRKAFSERAGLAAAGIIAVSPFAVYLAQEARQYTLLLILITVALFALVQLIKPAKPTAIYCLLWGIANSFGCYTHYFFFLSFVAQIIVLFLFFLWQSPRRLLLLLSVILGVILSNLPWLPTLITHFSSSKTDWLPSVDLFSPIYQLLLGFLVMVVTFPVENQGTFIQILSGLIMLSFGGWLLYRVSWGYQKLLQSPATRNVTLAFSLYVCLILLQFLVIIYVLEKNIAIAPRYNYVYYPAICALLGASLTAKIPRNVATTTERVTHQRSYDSRSVWGVIAVGIISSWFVVSNLFFLKPYLPEVTAQRFNQSSQPLLMVMAYQDEMDLALGLSYSLAVNQIRDESLTSKFIFLDRNEGYTRIWEEIRQLELNVADVWVIGTGLKRVAFPEEIGLNNNERTCQRDRANYYRIGIPYQRYTC